MLYIHCPFCAEKRDEQEFHYAGEAYIARPADPENCSDEEWGNYVFMRTNTKAGFGSSGSMFRVVAKCLWPNATTSATTLKPLTIW